MKHITTFNLAQPQQECKGKCIRLPYAPVIVPLPEEEHELLKEAFSSPVMPRPFMNNADTMQYLVRTQERFTRLMPEYILRDLLEMKLGAFTPAYYLITGLPVDDNLVQTPINGAWPEEKNTTVSEGILLGMALALGIPFGFLREKDGRMINQISPVPGKEESQTSASATNNLGMHVEVAYHHSLKPKWLILYCLRQDREMKAATTLIDMREVINKLPSWVIIELRKKQFQFKMPDSFANATIWSAARAILSGPIQNPEIIYDAKALQVVNNEYKGASALNYLTDEMSKPEYLQKVYLKPGHALIIPNHYITHGRSEFTPHFDGFDRWLQRVYVTDSIFYNRENMSDSMLVFKK